MDLGYIIINPEKNLTKLKVSVLSIRNSHTVGEPEIIHILPKDVSMADMKKFKESWPPTHKGGDTITSLINAGFDKIKSTWGMVVFAGANFKGRIQLKYSMFVDSEKDVLYPLVAGKYNFVDATTNGLTMRKKFFQEIGNFPENYMWKLVEENEEVITNSFDVCKLLWSFNAINKEAKFKAVIGCCIK